ncbi:hypothetical protein Pla175_45100 [Pirellulimonas nuda]|uniref:DUF3299 domain-containing protein n=1 Tax=Pirellulimonas nuda TaxID=2528009 RepID=A0A518DI67_9BACT|nr:DUF3299 domain-containing protein [Pirellulimonas nuda]QDU91092.1 hypothetical protein Pla175_45100 [Pirellulimonas nuda]
MNRVLLATLLIVTIAGCDVGADGAPSATKEPAEIGAAQAEQTEPAVAKNDPPPAVAPPPVPERTVDKSFDDLKFEMAEGERFRLELLTDEIEALEGKSIRIRGYILPPPQKRGLKSFVLVRDNMECCFGPGAALYDCILIEMAPGKTAEFSTRPVSVEGEFAVEVFPGPDDTPLAIYRMTGQRVK